MCGSWMPVASADLTAFFQLCRLPLQLVRSCAPQVCVGLLAIVRVLPEHSAAQRKQLEAAEKLLVDCCFPAEVRTHEAF